MDVRPLPNETFLRVVQYANVYCGISLIASGSEISSNAHWLNAYSPNSVTASGISIAVRPDSLKAYAPIFSSFEPSAKVTVVRFLLAKNIRSGSSVMPAGMKSV